MTGLPSQIGVEPYPTVVRSTIVCSTPELPGSHLYVYTQYDSTCSRIGGLFFYRANPVSVFPKSS